MTADEANRFLSAADGTWLEAMWVSMLYLGLRPGEAAALSWADIDFDANVVHVRKGRKRLGGRITVGTTKTPGSVRSLNAPTVVMDALPKPRHDQKLEEGARREIGGTTTTTSSSRTSSAPPPTRRRYVPSSTE